MRAILVHGMGRTPMSMLILAARLRRRGFQPAIFGYSATIESLQHCSTRLQRFIARKTRDTPFIVIGHSLGTVLLRLVYPQLNQPPVACFLMAPPVKACLIARTMAPRRLFKIMTGEMGQLLSDPRFMDALPIPQCPTRIYAGDAGPVGRWSPYGNEPNDGILTIEESTIPGVPLVRLNCLHTFIMNREDIAEDIARVVDGCKTNVSPST
ncbi:MAG: alpha/beta hydrolase [Pseudomonadota bacterium]